MIKKRELVLLIGLLAFAYLVFVHGLQWALDYTLSLFVAITIVYYLKDRLWGSIGERI